MLGVSSRAVAEWGVQRCASVRWLPVLQRIAASGISSNTSSICANCTQPLAQVVSYNDRLIVLKLISLKLNKYRRSTATLDLEQLNSKNITELIVEYY